MPAGNASATHKLTKSVHGYKLFCVAFLLQNRFLAAVRGTVSKSLHTILKLTKTERVNSYEDKQIHHRVIRPFKNAHPLRTPLGP